MIRMENIDKILKVDQKSLNHVIESMTTTVGIKVADGVVIGTESQATAGYTVATKTAQKLFEINNFTGATISGGVADCQYVINQLRAISKLREVERGHVPEPKYMANVLRNILFSGRSFFLSMMIIGGYSLQESQGKLYGVDLLGTFYEDEKYISYGSGSPFVLGVMEADWKPNMSKEGGIELIKTAISAAKERDAASGYNIQICTIDKNGYIQIQ